MVGDVACLDAVWRRAGTRLRADGRGAQDEFTRKATLLETAVFALAPPAMAQIHDSTHAPHLAWPSDNVRA
jgi:hypothetical protein